VLDPGDAALAARVDSWEQQGRARERARFDGLRVVEVLPRPGAGSGPTPCGLRR
jgi:hypothetical protein